MRTLEDINLIFNEDIRTCRTILDPNGGTDDSAVCSALIHEFGTFSKLCCSAKEFHT